MSAGALPDFAIFTRRNSLNANTFFARGTTSRAGSVSSSTTARRSIALDLYTKKSGDEIVGQLYNFTDKGGREVALRPEMTPTFARMVSARGELAAQTCPLVFGAAAVPLRAPAEGSPARALSAERGHRRRDRRVG
jgi:hypothetical protein